MTLSALLPLHTEPRLGLMLGHVAASAVAEGYVGWSVTQLTRGGGGVAV
jgi:hypothetical protein